ncbi:hypothetical protein ABZ682_22770 [Streptomyces griseoviridis]|uniref:hypothetical protein n=1 Tax=Streptomyces griseoviridis TaxID=45398 RepID=UPI0033FAE65E
MTAHGTLLALLGEWVTVTHPQAPNRVWHGQLASLMDCPSIVLHMPEGGTEVLPQTFDVHGAAPAPDGPYPEVDTDARSFSALRDSGLLWLINRVALHPRGLALALHVDVHGQAYGWSLISNGDGEPWTFDPATDNDGYVRAEKTIANAHDRGQDARARTWCTASASDAFHGRAQCERHPGTDGYQHEGTSQDGSTLRWNDGEPGTTGHQPDGLRTPPDAHLDADAQTSGRVRPPVLGTARTSTDAVRTPSPDDASGRPDAAQRQPCEDATVAAAREYLANATQLPLDLFSPPRCERGLTGPRFGPADGQHFHLGPEDDKRLTAERDDSLARIAWGNCWDRAEGLRADLERAAGAYDALRTRVITTSAYVHQQQRDGFPFRGGDHRQRILDRLAAWTDDPGPLNLASLPLSEEK